MYNIVLLYIVCTKCVDCRCVYISVFFFYNLYIIVLVVDGFMLLHLYIICTIFLYWLWIIIAFYVYCIFI